MKKFKYENYTIEDVIEMDSVREIYELALEWLGSKEVCQYLGDYFSNYENPFNWVEIEINGVKYDAIRDENSGVNYLPLEFIEKKGMDANALKDAIFYDEIEDWERENDWDRYMDKYNKRLGREFHFTYRPETIL